MRYYGHCEGCDEDLDCDGYHSHDCSNNCEEPHLTAEAETGLSLLESLLDMGLSEWELTRIAASADVSKLFRKYLIDNIQ